MNGDSRPLMVTIQCLTYNHEPYIRQCLEGFVMQKTNFRFEAIVHDDASTDGTADIIREYAEKYPDIIKPIIETENQYSKHDGSLDRIMDEHTHGKYVAFCEGDDYWIDPLKLQKQVDFMEANPEYGLVYGKAQYYIEKKGKKTTWFGGENESFEDIIYRNSIPTLTVLIRNSLYVKYLQEINPQKRGWKMGDYPTWIYIAHEAKIKYLPMKVAVYRVLESSASHSNDVIKSQAFVNSIFDIKDFFCDYFNYRHDFSSDRVKTLIVDAFIHNRRELTKKWVYELRNPSLKYIIVRIAVLNNFIFSIVNKLYKSYHSDYLG